MMMIQLALAVFLFGFAEIYGEELKHDHLVTMSPDELMDIIKCVSKTRDPIIYKQFEQCNNKMASQVITALKKCNNEVIPYGMKMCNYFSVLYDSPEIPRKIYECIAKSTTVLTPEEKKLMVNFEDCARKLYDETCNRNPRITGSFLKRVV